MSRQPLSDDISDHVEGQTPRERLLRFSRLRRRRLRYAVQATIVVACIAYLLINARQIQQYSDVFHVNVVYLAGSWLLTFLALWLGALAWGLILRSLDINLPWTRAAEAHLSANLAKYVPGFGWQLVGKAYLVREMGVSTKLVSLAMLCELAVLFLSGALLAAGIVYSYPVTSIPSLRLAVIVGGIVALITLIALPLLLPVVGRRLWKIDIQISLGTYLTAVVVVVVGWICFGIAFWLLGATLIPLKVDLLPLFVFALAGSFLVSLAILIIPGGIGVRESVMVFLIGTTIGSTPAVIIAAASRLILLLCEIVAAFTVRVLVRAR